MNLHPLIGSMEKAALVSPLFKLAVKDNRQSGWFPATELFLEDHDRLRNMVTAHGLEAWGSSNRRVAGSAFIIAYLTRLVWPVIGQYVLARRVPNVSLENLAFHLRDGRIDATAMIQPSFYLLPDDTAAMHADGSVVDDDEILFETLQRCLFDANLSRVVTSLHDSARASVNVSRNAVASACAQAFHFLYPVVDDQAKLVATAAAFFNSLVSLVHGQLTMNVFRHRGKEGFFARLRGCCLAWRIEESQYCSNCVLIPREEQDRRFRALLERPGPFVSVSGQ